ncbi:hypothetical protein SDC9_38419 [bioreactor metagenome]|uniref:Uncharacterized protein n=1 Tax=bioreactor metagenome TaxID=1076179 RepID=A0A644VLW3_9ZZZZ
MADIRLQVVAFQMRAQRTAQVMRGRGLTKPADVVAPALDGQQRRVPDRARVHLAALEAELAGRKLGLLEHPVDGLEVEFRGQVQHREIFVVERLDLARLGLLAIGEVLIQLLVLLAVAVHVHRHEGEQLHETRVDLAPRAPETQRHGADHRALEPLHRLLVRQIVDRGRAFAHIDRPRHQDQRARRRRVAVLGHHCGCGKRLHAGLAHREHMRPRADLFHEADQIGDVILDTEAARRQRRVAGIRPVGDVDVMVAQQRAHRARQQRGEMARERRRHQHLRQRRVEVAREMQQPAEGQLERYLLAHRPLAPVDLHRADAEARPVMAEAEAGDHLEPRRLRADQLREGAAGLGGEGEREMGGGAKRGENIIKRLVGCVKHGDSPR